MKSSSGNVTDNSPGSLDEGSSLSTRGSNDAESRIQHAHSPDHQLSSRSELALANVQLRALIDSTSDSICAIGKAYNLLVFNETYALGFERRFGYRPYTGMNILDPFRDDPAEREQVQVWWDRALQGEAHTLLREAVTRNGKKRFYDVRYAHLHSSDGQELGAVSVTRDITPIKTAEESLQQYNTVLQETNRQLENANRTLQQRNRELEDFAYVASHDLQEPLRKIRAFSDLVDREYQSQIDEEGRFFLSRIKNAASRMSQLISDLLSYSRITMQSNPFEPVNLNGIAIHVISDLQEQISSKHGNVTTDTLPVVEADATQMYQLFTNLLDNALKFSRDDVPPAIHVSADVDDTTDPKVCILTVQDNGIGFEAKYAERIFTPFQRLHGRNEYEGGTGIGLAICRRIVEHHGGTISVESTPGAGTKFMVRLPCKHRAADRLK